MDHCDPGKVVLAEGRKAGNQSTKVARLTVAVGGTQVELVLTFEEFCAEEGEFAGEGGAAFAAIFPQVRSGDRPQHPRNPGRPDRVFYWRPA